MNLKYPNKEGFTLLEVLIAMAVMIFISFAIYQATIETYKLRDTLQAEGEFYNTINLATSVIQHDISLIYSPYIPKKEDPQQGQPGTQPPPPAPTDLPDDLGRSFTYWSAALDATGLRPSRLIGTSDKLSFVALSHVRIYRESLESEFARISYEIKRDDKNTDNPGTMVLVKTESSNAFITQDIKDTFSHNYNLLPGIKSLTFTYYKRDGNTWKTSRSWDSDKEENKNDFPDMIEMKVEILGRKKQSFEGKFKFRPEMPLHGLAASI